MPYILIIAGALVALVLIFGAGGARNASAGPEPQRPAAARPARPASRPATRPSREIKLMSRAEMELKLARLEAAEAPEPKMGAMCYAVSIRPLETTYVCPHCGEKTLYAQDEARFISWELAACRREFYQLKGVAQLKLKLDESSFCKHCRPKAKEHRLVLTVAYADGTAHTTAPVSHWDLQILRYFLEGRVEYRTFNDGTSPVKAALPRLRELLGVSAQTKPSENLDRIP